MERFEEFNLSQLQVFNALLDLVSDNYTAFWRDTKESDIVVCASLHLGTDSFVIKLRRDQSQYRVKLQTEWECEVFISYADSLAELVELFTTIHTQVQQAIDTKTDKEA